jgi:hypothetical protein
VPDMTRKYIIRYRQHFIGSHDIQKQKGERNM